MWVRIYESETGQPGTFKLVCVTRADDERPSPDPHYCFWLSLVDVSTIPLRTAAQIRDNLWVLVVEQGAALPADLDVLLHKEAADRGAVFAAS